MKTVALVLVLAWLSVSKALAQPLCLDANQHESLRTQLEKAFPLAEELFDPGFRKRKAGIRSYDELTEEEKRLSEASGRLVDHLNEQFDKLGIMPVDSAWFLNLTLYVQPDGSLRHFAHDFVLRDRQPTGEQAARVQKLLCQWLTGYHHALTINTPYRIHRTILVGGNSPWRQARLRREHWERTQTSTRPDTVTTLTLTGMKLKEIPETLYRFTNLKTLDLSGNELTEVPERLFLLPKLKHLNLTGNRLTAESIHIARNKNLRVLNLQRNRLTRVPESVASNRRLTSLWLGYNDFSGGLNVAPLRKLRKLQDINLYRANLTSLPPEIGKLKRLEILDLYHNKLRSLPDGIGGLKRLQQLAVSNNQLGELPESLRRLKRLKTLYAHHNFLASLPNGLHGMRRLHLLDLNSNAFNYLPAPLTRLRQLHELNVSSNKLTSLPPELARMPGLKKLHLNGNPITTQKGLADIQPTLRQLEHNRTEVFY